MQKRSMGRVGLGMLPSLFAARKASLLGFLALACLTLAGCGSNIPPEELGYTVLGLPDLPEARSAYKIKEFDKFDDRSMEERMMGSMGMYMDPSGQMRPPAAPAPDSSDPAPAPDSSVPAGAPPLGPSP